MNNLSILTLIFSPLIFSGILFLFRNNEVKIRRFSKSFAAVHFLYSLLFLVQYNPLKQGLSCYDEVNFFGSGWVDLLGIKFSFGLDGISLILVILTSFLFLIAAIVSKTHIKAHHKMYYSLLFALETAVIGVFSAQDMFLFFMFWEFELVPMYFLISQWGGHNAEENAKAKASAMKFVLYTFFGSLFILLGILMLHFYNFASYGELTAGLREISVSSPDFPLNLQLIISVLFLIGFAVKMPIIPLHTWLPDAHVDAPTPVSMILAAILLKMGAYGIIRFNMQMIPEAFVVMAPYLAVFALINIVYAALVACSQQNLKRLIAYSSISNMGIVLLGLSTMTVMSFSGAYFHMLSHGVISAALFMIAGAVYARTKTYDIAKLGGLAAVMPRLAGFSVLFALASVGMPLLMGFVGEFLVFLGSFASPLENDDFPIKLVVASGVFVLILSAAYILKFLHGTFYENMFEKWKNIKDITNHEFFVLISLAAVVVFFGVIPMSLISQFEPALTEILQGFHF